MSVRCERDGDWWRFTGLSGWPDHAVSIQAAIVGGTWQLTGLRVKPLTASAPPALTARALRHLPTGFLVRFVAGHMRGQVRDADDAAMREVFEMAKRSRSDPRAATTPEAVAVVWMAAYRRGDRDKRAQVCKALRIEPRTADRYIKRARDMGLLNTEEDDT